jgi:hypothetical protein
MCYYAAALLNVIYSNTLLFSHLGGSVHTPAPQQCTTQVRGQRQVANGVSNAAVPACVTVMCC